MTAIVGILNKQAVAIAADSAVTVTGANGTKIYNHANKIFTLSKHHPVGVMLYNSASFMGIPWETIIKMYRKKLKDQAFDKLSDYADDFIVFLKAKKFFIDESLQINVLNEFVFNTIEILRREASQEHPELLVDPFSDKNYHLTAELIEKHLDSMLPAWEKKTEYCPDFEDYTLETFLEDVPEVVRKEFAKYFSPELQDKIFVFLHCLICKQETQTSYTGLVFVGFGDEEIFPSLIPYNISFATSGRLRYYKDQANHHEITHLNNGVIVPFAQFDVIHTILKGIAPDLMETIGNAFEEFLVEYNSFIFNEINSDKLQNPELANQIDIEKVRALFIGQVNDAQQKTHVDPLLQAVGMLSKEDLAEMAESLIYLTYLKRRITFAQESVGGPVDVALISKGDGFVWIKRKHYFKPENNHSFITNYLNQ